jgi:hypothetical protein
MPKYIAVQNIDVVVFRPYSNDEVIRFNKDLARLEYADGATFKKDLITNWDDLIWTELEWRGWLEDISPASLKHFLAGILDLLP